MNWFWGPFSAPNPRDFAQPSLSRSSSSHPQREGANSVCLLAVWLVLLRCEATGLGVFDRCHFDLLKRGCANSGGFGARWPFSGTVRRTFAVWRRGGDIGGREDIGEQKNTAFLQKRHDNKILKMTVLLSSNFVVIAQAPSFSEGYKSNLGTLKCTSGIPGFFGWRLFWRVRCIGNIGNSCEFWRFSLGKPTEIHHNSGVSAVCANYDGFPWVFPRKVIRIRMNSRNSLYNAPAKKVSNSGSIWGRDDCNTEAIQEAHLGPNHPDVATSLDHLARVLFAQRRSSSLQESETPVCS